MSGNANSGRKPKNYLRSETSQTIAETSPRAAQYLQRVADGQEKADGYRIDVCKYIINQDLGLPKARTELSGKDGADLPAVNIVVRSEQSKEILDSIKDV